MRHAILLASRVKPLGWAHATRLTYAPRQNLLRPCALLVPIYGQRRFLQPSPTPDDLDHSAQHDQVSENDPTNRSTKESSQSTELKSRHEASSIKQVKDQNWVWQYTGGRIEPINVKALKGIEEYVSHSSGTKLLCSWTVAPGDERAIWVPGKASLPIECSYEPSYGRKD